MFVANLLTQPESTGRPIIIIIITIIILVIITWWCQSRSLTRYLFAACLVFYTCENIRQVPRLTWVSWFPPEAYGLGTRLVRNSFNRVIFCQEGFTLQICLCWCNEHIASVAYKCNGKPWPCPVRYVKSNCPSGRRPLSQIKMEIEMQRGQS